MEKTWKNIFISYCHPENNNLLFEIFHFATRANEYVYRWTNQRHLKTPLCYYCEKFENMTYLFIDSKKAKKIWEFFQKFYHKLNPTYTNTISK